MAHDDDDYELELDDSPTRMHIGEPTSPTRHDATPPSERTTNLPPGDSLEERIKRKLADHDGAAGGGDRGDPLVGMTINNRFVITSKIGAGGMGAVYRASQLGMNRDVAIKVLLRELTENETVLRRFHLEALAVSKLKHPNTIQIFDFGETDDGLLYIAMELLEGKPLAKVLTDEKQCSVRRALRIIEQTIKSLREAHSKGIVHRDLKPDNIFLSSVGEDGDFVKVLDFGVAKVAEGDGQQKTLTKAGSIFGTPKYMSPEQSRGTEIDARSDIYSIGVILYELLTGRVPFNADNPLGILIKHIQEAPPAFQAVRPDLVIPEQVERFVAKLLAKMPEQRPQTAEACIRDIEKLLAELPPLFRNVVTRADAEAAGIEIQTLSVTALDTDLGVGSQTIHRADTMYGEKLVKRRRWPFVVLLALLLVVGSAGVIYASLQPLTKDYYEFTTLGAIDVPLLEEFDVEGVLVLALSEPSGADVLNEGGAIVGQTPFKMFRNKNAPSERYTFRKDGFRDYIRGFDFDQASDVNIKLDPVEVVKPVTGDTKPVTGDTKPPDPTTPTKVEDTKPNPFDGPKKIDDTKSNPYGSSGGGGSKPDDSPKANPYGN